MEDEKFRQELDELFRLFKKLMEDKSIDEVPGIDKNMLQQFQFFFNNYENMKDQIAYQLQGQFGEPVREMVRTLVKQLREEFGEDYELIEQDDDIPVIDMDDLGNDIKKIDEMLTDPNLTPEQIDELLDKRAGLTKP
jgi:translation initiation factor 2 alpha subunit (eIF-2alpha)